MVAFYYSNSCLWTSSRGYEFFIIIKRCKALFESIVITLTTTILIFWFGFGPMKEAHSLLLTFSIHVTWHANRSIYVHCLGSCSRLWHSLHPLDIKKISVRVSNLLVPAPSLIGPRIEAGGLPNKLILLCPPRGQSCCSSTWLLASICQVVWHDRRRITEISISWCSGDKGRVVVLWRIFFVCFNLWLFEVEYLSFRFVIHWFVIFVWRFQWKKIEFWPNDVLGFLSLI